MFLSHIDFKNNYYDPNRPYVFAPSLKSMINHSPAQTTTISSSNATSKHNRQQKQPANYLYNACNAHHNHQSRPN